MDIDKVFAYLNKEDYDFVVSDLDRDLKFDSFNAAKYYYRFLAKNHDYINMDYDNLLGYEDFIKTTELDILGGYKAEFDFFKILGKKEKELFQYANHMDKAKFINALGNYDVNSSNLLESANFIKLLASYVQSLRKETQRILTGKIILAFIEGKEYDDSNIKIKSRLESILSEIETFLFHKINNDDIRCNTSNNIDSKTIDIEPEATSNEKVLTPYSFDDSEKNSKDINVEEDVKETINEEVKPYSFEDTKYPHDTKPTTKTSGYADSKNGVIKSFLDDISLEKKKLKNTRYSNPGYQNPVYVKKENSYITGEDESLNDPLLEEDRTQDKYIADEEKNIVNKSWGGLLYLFTAILFIVLLVRGSVMPPAFLVFSIIILVIEVLLGLQNILHRSSPYARFKLIVLSVLEVGLLILVCQTQHDNKKEDTQLLIPKISMATATADSNYIYVDLYIPERLGKKKISYITGRLKVKNRYGSGISDVSLYPTSTSAKVFIGNNGTYSLFSLEIYYTITYIYFTDGTSYYYNEMVVVKD